MPVKEKRKTLEEKIVWQATQLQKISLSDREKLGYHLPEKHLNPYEVAPMRRDDGKTFCEKCDLTMVPWEKLDQPLKDGYILQVKRFQDIERAWNVENA